MGSCVSKPYVAPCCRCYQLRIFRREYNQNIMVHTPKGLRSLGRYRLKKKVSEQDRAILYGAGYRELFPDDLNRYLYSCDVCYDEAGSLVPDAWEYNQNGFMRK